MRIEHDADGAARHLMVGTNKLVINLRDGIRGQGESQAGIGVGFGKNGGVDADDFAGHVDQRTAGIARIDGGVGLNEGLKLRLGTILRPLAETIPAVTVSCKPKGLPMASTQSPTCMLSEFPSLAAGNGLSISILITARSVS